MYPTPKRERRKVQKPQETDPDRAHLLFAKIVREHEQRRGDFAQALAVQLHHMRLAPSTLLTSEGFDAVSAVAMALGDIQTLAWSKIQLPKTWLKALEAIGVRPSNDLVKPNTNYSSFSNGIRIR